MTPLLQMAPPHPRLTRAPPSQAQSAPPQPQSGVSPGQHVFGLVVCFLTGRRQLLRTLLVELSQRLAEAAVYEDWAIGLLNAAEYADEYSKSSALEAPHGGLLAIRASGGGCRYGDRRAAMVSRATTTHGDGLGTPARRRFDRTWPPHFKLHMALNIPPSLPPPSWVTLTQGRPGGRRATSAAVERTARRGIAAMVRLERFIDFPA